MSNWVERRIQPLKARDHPMFEYSGPKDLTHYGESDLLVKLLEARMCLLMKEREDHLQECLVRAFS